MPWPRLALCPGTLPGIGGNHSGSVSWKEAEAAAATEYARDRERADTRKHKCLVKGCSAPLTQLHDLLYWAEPCKSQLLITHRLGRKWSLESHKLSFLAPNSNLSTCCVICASLWNANFLRKGKQTCCLLVCVVVAWRSLDSCISARPLVTQPQRPNF